MKERILVVDDEPKIVKLARDYLERAGFAVLTAADGQEAVDLLKKHKDEVSVAMLDAVMPRLGGKDAYDQMQRIRNEWQSGSNASVFVAKARQTLLDPAGKRGYEKRFSAKLASV